MKTKIQKQQQANEAAAAQPPVQDVDDQGQPIGGAAAEPPEDTGQVDNAAPATEEDAATVEEQRREKIAAKGFKDTGRSAIAAKLSAARAKENDEFRQQNPEQAEIAERIAGAPSTDLIARMEAEARGEPDPAQVEASTPAVEQRVTPPPQKKPDQPLASVPKTYTIRVYGKDETLTEEQVIAAAQKFRAGTIRLDDVATREAQLEEYAGQLQAYADQLRARAQDGTRSQPTGGSANPQPPDTGAAGQVDKTKLREAQAALLRGDDEAATEIMAQVIASAIAQRPQAQPPAEVRSSEQGAVPELPARNPKEPWSRDDRVKINQVFSRDFGDLLEDDDAFADAQALMNARLSSPSSLGKTPEALAAEVGEAVRRARGIASADPPPRNHEPSVVERELESRRTLKAQIPITPPAGSARAPAAAKAPRFQSNSEYVQSLRQRSGSNSTR